MVAIIKTGNSIRRAFYYNEQKLNSGVEECIMAANYPIDVDVLTEEQRLNCLLNQAALNENVKRNSVHISLNFAPGEQLSKVRLCEIASAYMEKIGFANQPYLVYEHHDAGHPHIHIVSIKVRANGSRIDTQNIGRNQSEKARKEIEEQFHLVRAEEHKRQLFKLKPVNVQKAVYGKSETKHAITNVLDAVLLRYKYTSIAELNAVLNQYNIAADRGTENSRIYLNNGLVYRLLEEQGNKVGVPIKASDIYNKPTLSFLENRFLLNEIERKRYASRVKNSIDLAFLKHAELPLKGLIQILQNEGIHTALRQNKEGMIYGITFVDHQTKCVFNGSDLGKNYSTARIIERCSLQQNFSKNQTISTSDNSLLSLKKDSSIQPEFNHIDHQRQPFMNIDESKLLDILLLPTSSTDYLPHALKGNKKKRRKRLRANL
ncbi:relaxase/mobilization nuclease domain-containing protein [Solitalea canadensis]|uniref:Relaxase/mobilization nuclease n=1 Tax=Solitalea canadensis (strain ATCC 29591 / DSM 3403 / JCM 21819 / LMG 8368 / NBRC 15130 / NCIMB 12057 / USAM 9D) TaxID=929556 RepID=H8KXN4_SOLCM|nr:relaxase/mobilization nuclease domain-containing protein [Solitalea canadensis]AFD05330.1 relaxase/mobilization nuclease [Solitalea canadensis DSM 3403]